MRPCGNRKIVMLPEMSSCGRRNTVYRIQSSASNGMSLLPSGEEKGTRRDGDKETRCEMGRLAERTSANPEAKGLRQLHLLQGGATNLPRRSPGNR